MKPALDFYGLITLVVHCVYITCSIMLMSNRRKWTSFLSQWW